jgi:hypothetical protein
MADIIDAVLQDARVLSSTAEKYAAQLVEAGITADVLTGFGNLINEVEQKVQIQASAEEAIKENTRAQNSAMKKAEKSIKKIRTAAKGVFSKEKGIVKEFHIGKNIPNSVMGLTTELQYIKETALKYKDRLVKKIKDADIDALKQCETELVEKDKAQEIAKKSSATATAERNRTAKSLQDAMYDIRNSAAIAFADGKDTLKEFKSIIRTSKKKSEPTAPPPTS